MRLNVLAFFGIALILAGMASAGTEAVSICVDGDMDELVMRNLPLMWGLMV